MRPNRRRHLHHPTYLIMFFRFVLLLALLSTLSARAQSTWKSTTNKNWSTNGNWSGGVPNSSTAVAQFGATSVSEINVTGTVTVHSIEFTADAPAYTFFHKNGSVMTLSGAGIVNESSASQTFDVKANSDTVQMVFSNSATAGNAVIGAQGTWQYAGAIEFLDTSSAGTAQLTLRQYGSVTFDETSTAAHATITIQENGTATFKGSSTAAYATINLSPGGSLLFSGQATAGSATLNAPRGTLVFGGESSLGNATVNMSNSAGIKFEGNATAGTGVISGVGSLHVDTDGTFVLSGEHTYSGTTKVTDGQLVVNGSLPNTEMVEVFHGKTLGGSGTIGGLVALHPFARLDPGDSIGTLTIDGGLLLTGYSIVDFGLGTQSDLIRLTGGTFSYAPVGGHPVTLNLSDSGGFTAGTYTLFDFTTGGVTLSDIGLNNFILGDTIAGFDYSLDFADNTLTLTATASAIPEPSTYAALFGVIALGFCALRKRRSH